MELAVVEVALACLFGGGWSGAFEAAGSGEAETRDFLLFLFLRRRTPHRSPPVARNRDPVMSAAPCQRLVVITTLSSGQMLARVAHIDNAVLEVLADRVVPPGSSRIVEATLKAVLHVEAGRAGLHRRLPPLVRADRLLLLLPILGESAERAGWKREKLALPPKEEHHLPCTSTACSQLSAVGANFAEDLEATGGCERRMDTAEVAGERSLALGLPPAALLRLWRNVQPSTCTLRSSEIHEDLCRCYQKL